MRVDLRLKRLQLGLAQIDLLAAHRDHELLDLSDHVAEGGREVLHLAHARDRLIGEIVR